MRVFHSVRTRIILISTFLLLLFIVAYTVTVWTVADSYALMNTSQTNVFSLSLLAEEIDNNLDNVKALVTRVSIDNELKNYLSYNETNLDSYYDSFESMILSSPAYNVIDRFIVSDRSYSRFLQTGGATLSSGRPLRQDYFLDEISHINAQRSFSGLFFSDLAYRDYQVLGILMPIIDYNSGLTTGYVYASVNVNSLLRNLYSYQKLNNAELYIYFSGSGYKVENNSLVTVSSYPAASGGKPVMTNTAGSVYESSDGSYLLTIESKSNNFKMNMVFPAPSLAGASAAAPLAMLFVMIGIIVSLIALILYIYLNRALYRPVRKLALRIEKIQQSDFSQDEDINTEDEFGIIGRGINKLSSEVTDLMDRRVEDERKKLELEYKMLSSQINPHFLYNTFNSIKWMAKIQKAEGISEMITSLSRLMKNISKRDATAVTLSEEMSFIDDYLVIMKYRYGNTIQYTRRVDEGCCNILLPRFCLQPLVENAIFHGIEPRGTGAVAIIAAEYPDHYVIMVADNGVGFDTSQTESRGDGVFKNIGLDNIRQRLAYTYGDAAAFEITSTVSVGTQCIIRIRKENEGEKE